MRSRGGSDAGHTVHRISYIYIGIAERAQSWAGIVDRLIRHGVITYDDLSMITEAGRLWRKEESQVIVVVKGR